MEKEIKVAKEIYGDVFKLKEIEDSGEYKVFLGINKHKKLIPDRKIIAINKKTLSVGDSIISIEYAKKNAE